MNVVIFGKGFGKPRQVSLSGKSVAAIVSLCSLAIFITAAVGGYYFSVFTGSGVSVSRIASINSELQGQRNAIATTRQQTEDTLDALAIRIGQMNARVIRLDALGRRLTEMAELTDGEFDFDSEPAIGGPGPDEPTATGSAVAVPEVLVAMNDFDQFAVSIATRRPGDNTVSNRDNFSAFLAGEIDATMIRRFAGERISASAEIRGHPSRFDRATCRVNALT